MKRLDIRLPLSDGALSIVPAADEVRIYESSMPGSVTVVLLREPGFVYAGTRISRASARDLFHALGDYLIATRDDQEG